MKAKLVGATISITIVGLDLEEEVRQTFLKYKEHINKVNQVKYGHLGNFRTLTYFLRIQDNDMASLMKSIANDLSLPGANTMCMCKYGVPGDMYVFKRSAFKFDEK